IDVVLHWLFWPARVQHLFNLGRVRVKVPKGVGLTCGLVEIRQPGTEIVPVRGDCLKPLQGSWRWRARKGDTVESPVGWRGTSNNLIEQNRLVQTPAPVVGGVRI